METFSRKNGHSCELIVNDIKERYNLAKSSVNVNSTSNNSHADLKMEECDLSFEFNT